MTHRIATVDFRVYNFVNYSDFECLEPMVPLKPWNLTVNFVFSILVTKRKCSVQLVDTITKAIDSGPWFHPKDRDGTRIRKYGNRPTWTLKSRILTCNLSLQLKVQRSSDWATRVPFSYVVSRRWVNIINEIVRYWFRSATLWNCNKWIIDSENVKLSLD